MGIEDRIRQGVDKVKGLMNEHGDKVDEGVDKATGFINDKTGGKYADKIGKASEKIKGMTKDKKPGQDDPPASEDRPRG